VRRVVWAITAWRRETFLAAAKAGECATYTGQIGLVSVGRMAGYVIKTQEDLDIAAAMRAIPGLIGPGSICLPQTNAACRSAMATVPKPWSAPPLPAPESRRAITASASTRTRRWRWRTALTAGLLGIGADAHTASLFPDRDEAGDANGDFFAVPETPPHKHPRLTLGRATLREIATTAPIALIIAGGAKHRALAAALARAATLGEMEQLSIFQDSAGFARP